MLSSVKLRYATYCGSGERPNVQRMWENFVSEGAPDIELGYRRFNKGAGGAVAAV